MLLNNYYTGMGEEGCQKADKVYEGSEEGCEEMHSMIQSPSIYADAI